MLRLDQRGVAAVTVVVIIAISLGAAVATPVVVDVADVDPDHPLYGLERLGERIRMIGDEDQMKERCIEAYRMYERGKTEAYREVFKEFVKKAEVLLAKPEVKEKVKAWLESEEQRVGVVIDIYNVEPDHLLYKYEKKGELIREIEPEELMKERWGEYARLVNRGKGLEYKEILEEFAEKMRTCVPGDVKAKQEVVQWIQDQMPGIGKVQLKLSKELCGGLKDDLPEVGEEIDEILDEIKNCEEEFGIAELRENARARLRLIREKIENIVKLHEAQIVRPVNIYFDIDNVLVDADVTMNVEVYINIVRPVPITTAEFEEELEEFNELLAEVQAMLEGAPENTLGKRAAERLVEVAIKLKDEAVTAYDEGRIRKAFALIHAAEMHLHNAKLILEHASKWEPGFTGQWTQWRERWQELKQELIEEGVLENILGNWEQFAENVRQRWRERLLGT